MTNRLPDALTDAAAQTILERIAPGTTLTENFALDEGSNSTWRVSGQRHGDRLDVVVRRYAIFGSYDRGEKARREFKLFQLLQNSAVPVPEPLLLDDTGDLLGSPGIVTRFVSGSENSDPARAGAMARTLVDIHRVPVDAPDVNFLLDANSEALWFLNSATLPDYMARHPRGAEVDAAIRRLLPKLEPVPAALVHLDYWTGQLLWQGDRIVAVVDWEEVARGDPAIDVAYCRMDFFMAGLPDAGNEFLRVYEQGMQRKVANLSLWSLAAAVRPMFSWKLDAVGLERLDMFISDALRRSGL